MSLKLFKLRKDDSLKASLQMKYKFVNLGQQSCRFYAKASWEFLNKTFYFLFQVLRVWESTYWG